MNRLFMFVEPEQLELFPVANLSCQHTWSEWERVGRHVERKCQDCGKEQYDD